MLELDLIFGHFLTHQLNQLTEQQLTVFEDLLTYPDPDLYAWLMGYEQPKQKELLDIVTFIRANDKI
jgi:antitoxin CptB